MPIPRPRQVGVSPLRPVPARCAGAVLVTVLAVLLALMIVGITAARLGLDDERSARHERDRQLAFHAAEAAQQDSLFNLGQVVFVSPEQAEVPVWQSNDLGNIGHSIPYGTYSNAVLASGEGNLPAHPPGFVVEKLATPPSAPLATDYRITSVGFGSEPGQFVVLQTLVRVNPDGKKTRLSWREIGNWRELHDALHSSE